jgi:hypothetical protein
MYKRFAVDRDSFKAYHKGIEAIQGHGAYDLENKSFSTWLVIGNRKLRKTITRRIQKSNLVITGTNIDAYQ